MVEIAVLANLVTYIFMYLRYNLWQMISFYSLGWCIRIKGWVCTYQFPISAVFKFVLNSNPIK